MEEKTYKGQLKEIVVCIAEALAHLEVDFDNETFLKALNKMKEYPYTSDNYDENKTHDWEDYICNEDE